MSTTEKTNGSERSPVDLTQDLKRSSRVIKILQVELDLLPRTLPEHFVREAEIEIEITNLKAERSKIGKALLEHDRASQDRRIEQSEEAAKKRDELVAEYLKNIASFTSAARSISIMGKKFDQLLDEGEEIRKLNSMAARAGLAKPYGVIFPDKLRRYTRDHIISSFGGIGNFANLNPVRNRVADDFSLQAVIETAIKSAVDALESPLNDN
jgi:hypothetical protein